MIKVFPDAVTKKFAVKRMEKLAFKDAVGFNHQLKKIAPFLGCFCVSNEEMHVTQRVLEGKVFIDAYIYTDKELFGDSKRSTITIRRVIPEQFRKELIEVYTKTFEEIAGISFGEMGYAVVGAPCYCCN
ncbi:MAG: hypothetical protein J6C46_05360 [Clostridia bacterium]|nr:hypothetical protein [Clostridia bacterium]